MSMNNQEGKCEEYELLVIQDTDEKMQEGEDDECEDEVKKKNVKKEEGEDDESEEDTWTTGRLLQQLDKDIAFAEAPGSSSAFPPSSPAVLPKFFGQFFRACRSSAEAAVQPGLSLMPPASRARYWQKLWREHTATKLHQWHNKIQGLVKKGALDKSVLEKAWYQEESSIQRKPKLD